MKMREPKIFKARKEYVCSCCKKPIKKGNMYELVAYRTARYNEGEDFHQIGIQYISYRLHLHNCECEK